MVSLPSNPQGHEGRRSAWSGGEVLEADETYLKPRKPRKGAPTSRKSIRRSCSAWSNAAGNFDWFRCRERRWKICGPHWRSTSARCEDDLHGRTPDIRFRTTRELSGQHGTINHSRTYVAGEVHTNTVENAFSLLKRGLYGTFHQVSIKHLGRYCEEFSYRFNRRYEQSEMFDVTLRGLLREKPLQFKALTGSGTEPF